MNKKDIRKKYREVRKGLKGSVCSLFYESDIYANAKYIFTFVSYGSEINTYELIERAINDNKTVAVPYMTGEAHSMVFIEINSLNELKPNKIGIYEPEYREENIVMSDKNTVIIVPGLAFDKKFARIGYGGGYYDKYLSENVYNKAVGVCFEEQICDSLPEDKYDVKVDVIVTDKNIRRP